MSLAAIALVVFPTPKMSLNGRKYCTLQGVSASSNRPYTVIAVQLGRVRELLCKMPGTRIVCQFGQIDKSESSKIRSDEKRLASIGASSDRTQGAVRVSASRSIE